MRRLAVMFVAFFGLVVTSAAAAPPGPPTITEPGADGQVLNPADVHMEAAGFSDADGHTHQCSDWEIWTIAPAEPVWQAPCAAGFLKVHIHLGDGEFENAYAGRAELAFETDYRLRVRFRDSAGETSQWAERPFTTSPQGPPGLPGPKPWAVLQPGFEVDLVASDFQLPVNIAFVPDPGPQPDDPFFYVTELYGSIKVVSRDGTVSTYASGLLNFNPTGAFPGSGEQGLTGIAVEPASGDLFVTLLYEDTTDPARPHYPKVVRFHSNDGGRTAATQTIVLNMSGEPQGQSHQISNVSFGPDEKLYIHNGDGFYAPSAQSLASYRGKVLRMNLDGTPAPGNPFYNPSDGTTARDYVFAYGLRNPFGGAWRTSDSSHYTVENGPSVDRFAKVVSGRNYLWDGSNNSMRNFALYNWDPAHAPVNIAFVQPETAFGSGYPVEKMDHAFVSESGPTYAEGPQSRGKRISEFVLDVQGALVSGPTALVEYTGTGRATVVALAAGPDGLYFSDLYKDTDYTSPIDSGARIWRVRYVAPFDPSPLENLAPNADVELDPATNYKSAGAGTFVWATDGSRSPTHSFKVVSTQAPASYARWLTRTKEIEVVPGRAYEVSAWFKTLNVSRKAQLFVTFWTASGSSSIPPAMASSSFLNGTTDWTRLLLEATAPANAAYMRIELRLYGPGTMWADDLEVFDAGQRPPQNIAPPEISGTPAAGQTLIASTGSWTGDPSGYAYLWLRCSSSGTICTEIGATDPSYTVLSEDVGFRLRARVIATNAIGPTSAESAATDVVSDEATNLAPNPDVELDPAADYTRAGAGTFVWATDESHSPTHSLKVVSTQATGSYASWMTRTNEIGVLPGRVYDVSAWFKTQNVSQKAQLFVTFWPASGSSIPPAWKSVAFSNGTTGWSPLSLRATAPANAAYLRIELRLYGPGTMWADDLAVLEASGP